MVIGPQEATSGEVATHHLLLPVTPDHTTGRPAGRQIMGDTLFCAWVRLCVGPAYYFVKRGFDHAVCGGPALAPAVSNQSTHTWRRGRGPPFTTTTHLQC